MSGGTGSGIVVDLVRHLSNVKLGRRIPVVGVASMPFSGDEEHAGGAAALYPTMNEFDCMLDDAKNEGVMAVWGDLYKNPFTGGFFALPQEHSWQRLGSYTQTGKPAIRDALRRGVTRKFVNDSFTRFVVQDYGRLLFKMLRPAGFTGAPHERNISGDRTWTLFDVAKFTHPGVEVLPGEPRSKWREVVGKWIDYIPQFSGLKDGFKTDYVEAHTVSPRELWNETLQKRLEAVLGQYVLEGEDGTVNTTVGEFFDELTAYSNIIIPGVAKSDFKAFYEARDAYDAIEDWEEKLMMHSWLLDLGVIALRAVDPVRRYGRRMHLGLRLLGRRAARGHPRRRTRIEGPHGRTAATHRRHDTHGGANAVNHRSERPATRTGRSASVNSVVDITLVDATLVDAEFTGWVERLRSTHRAVAFTCKHRLSEPEHAEPLAVRVVAGLLARPTVFRYFGLPFSGRIASLAERLIADAEAGRPPGPANWSELENRVLSMPDHHQTVFVSVCLNGDDVDTLAAKLGCEMEEATRRRTALITYMRDVVAGDLTATADEEG